MYRYRDNNGQTIEGRTAQAVVRHMRDLSWVDQMKGVYMSQVAWRIHQMNGDAIITSDDAESFLFSMVQYGFLTPLED